MIHLKKITGLKTHFIALFFVIFLPAGVFASDGDIMIEDGLLPVSTPYGFFDGEHWRLTNDYDNFNAPVLWLDVSQADSELWLGHNGDGYGGGTAGIQFLDDRNGWAMGTNFANVGNGWDLQHNYRNDQDVNEFFVPFSVNSVNNVGIWTNLDVPTSTLTVFGHLQLLPTTTPTVADIGQIYVNESDRQLYWYNGTQWVLLGVSSTTMMNTNFGLGIIIVILSFILIGFIYKNIYSDQ